MRTQIRVLIVEDNEDDAVLLIKELERGDFNPKTQRVETREAMTTALREQVWDLVVSDYSLPRFDALGAIATVKETGLDIPVIVISGTIGEDTAITALKAGAQDFVLKSSRTRLLPAIERELREASIRAEQRKMQQQLLISERMASVGTLAAGVAHEINNPLASVMANLDLAVRDFSELTQQLKPSELVTALQEELRDAREGAERVRQIVRDLKIFSRSSEEKKGAVDVERILESSLRMAWNEIRHRAQLVKTYGRVPLVSGAESRLGQVFLNLIVNAAQAMQEGCADENQIRISTRLEGAKVVVEIADTGAGIPSDVKDKLFTPFFTTKPIGVGTGLGLSICYRIITDLGGEIDFDSEMGKGTTFRVTLAVAGPAGESFVPPAVAITAPGRRGTILVVDDEPMIARAVRRTLGMDHEITIIEHARDALALIAGGQRFDVILCDLMMPEMTGMDLYNHLAREIPDQARAMIFLTGGAFTPRARAFLDETANQRIEKPFDILHLRAIINDRMR